MSEADKVREMTMKRVGFELLYLGRRLATGSVPLRECLIVIMMRASIQHLGMGMCTGRYGGKERMDYVKSGIHIAGRTTRHNCLPVSSAGTANSGYDSHVHIYDFRARDFALVQISSLLALTHHRPRLSSGRSRVRGCAISKIAYIRT